MTLTELGRRKDFDKSFFVDFPTRRGMEDSMKQLDGLEISGKTIRVYIDDHPGGEKKRGKGNRPWGEKKGDDHRLGDKKGDTSSKRFSRHSRERDWSRSSGSDCGESSRAPRRNKGEDENSPARMKTLTG